MNRHTWDEDVDDDGPVSPVELSERHWMSALNRPGVKNTTEHSWNAFSSLFNAGMRMLQEERCILLVSKHISPGVNYSLIRSRHRYARLQAIVVVSILKVLIELNRHLHLMQHRSRQIANADA